MLPHFTPLDHLRQLESTSTSSSSAVYLSVSIVPTCIVFFPSTQRPGIQASTSYSFVNKMSLLGKRRLGVSSPYPYQPQPNYQVPTQPVSEDIEDLESLIRSTADELERAEREKDIMAADGKDTWSSGSEGTRSPDLLATPVSAITSPMIGLDTTSPMGRSQNSPTSSILSSREGRDKPVHQSKSRPKERSQATTTSASKSTPAPTTGNEKRKPDKVGAKSKTKAPTDGKAQSTRTRSRREGLERRKGTDKADGNADFARSRFTM
jgi:hypothetical protein